MKHLPLSTCKRLAHLVGEHEGMWHCIFKNGHKVLDIDTCQDEETLGFLKRDIEKYPALDLSEALELLPERTGIFRKCDTWVIDLEDSLKYHKNKDLLTAVDQCLNWLLDNNHLKEGK